MSIFFIMLFVLEISAFSNSLCFILFHFIHWTPAEKCNENRLITKFLSLKCNSVLEWGRNWALSAMRISKFLILKSVKQWYEKYITWLPTYIPVYFSKFTTDWRTFNLLGARLKTWKPARYSAVIRQSLKCAWYCPEGIWYLYYAIHVVMYNDFYGRL